MKIAICSSPGTSNLGPFGRGSDLAIWNVEGSTVVNRQLIRQEGGCCGGLARSVLGVDVVLCSAIGHGALNHLVEQGTAIAMPRREEPTLVEDMVGLWLSGATDQFHVAAGACGHSAGSCCDNNHHEEGTC